MVRRWSTRQGQDTFGQAKSRATDKEKVPLSAEDATMYRSIAVRAAYLAQDRPDLQTATRSLAQGLQSPTSRHWNMLKRLARYVRYRPRVAQLFPNQSACNPFNMWSDADHAGCIRTRKSVSGGVLIANKCCLTHTAKVKELSPSAVANPSTTDLFQEHVRCLESHQLQETGACFPAKG